MKREPGSPLDYAAPFYLFTLKEITNTDRLRPPCAREGQIRLPS